MTNLLKQLKDTETKYRPLFEATNTGYLIVDGMGNVVDANQEYVRAWLRTSTAFRYCPSSRTTPFTKTQRRTAQGRQRTSEHRHTIPDVFYVVDLEGRFVSWNKAVERIVGYTADELQGRSVMDADPP